MAGGKRLAGPEPLDVLRSRFAADLAALPEAARRVRRPSQPRVRWSAAAEALRQAVSGPLAGHEAASGV